jgi:catechol 2,3-dioxygenase
MGRHGRTVNLTMMPNDAEKPGLPSAGAYGVAPPGFRLPADTRLGPVVLQVSDLTRSVGYYERTIGLRVASGTPDRAMLAAGDAGGVLVELRARPGVRPAPRGGTLGLFHFAIVVPDRPTLGRFLHNALALGAVSGLADHAVSEAVYLTDPDGLGIEVYADRPRERWRPLPDRQLHVTTEALDVGAVLDAAGGEPFDGLPDGTRMGHVHLHVGDLGDAEAFYHRALGFDKVVWSYPGALFMSAGGYHHHLGTNTWSRGGPAGDDQARLLSWQLALPDDRTIQHAAQSLERSGFNPTRQRDGWIAADPWGTTVEVRPAGARDVRVWWDR